MAPSLTSDSDAGLYSGSYVEHNPEEFFVETTADTLREAWRNAVEEIEQERGALGSPRMHEVQKNEGKFHNAARRLLRAR